MTRELSDNSVSSMLTVFSGSLSEAERLEYVDAVKCLQQLPPRTPSTAAAGAKSRVSIKQWTDSILSTFNDF